MSTMGEIVPVTVTVTAYNRTEQTLVTIGNILECRPAPDEVLIHVDAGQYSVAESIRETFPELSVLVSADSIGPGGGRNRLMREARNELIVNFDDDSYPLDLDFFGRVMALFTKFPEASAFGAAIYHRHETILPPVREIAIASSFVGCGVAFRRADFLEAGGYIPLPIAYGAEEEDIALRLFHLDKSIYISPWLRVFHDSSLAHHSDPDINAHAIANIALLAFLRYPKRYFPLGTAQVASRVLWCMRVGRWRGIGRGLALIFSKLWRFRSQRAPVSPAALAAKRRARHARSSIF